MQNEILNIRNISTKENCLRRFSMILVYEVQKYFISLGLHMRYEVPTSDETVSYLEPAIAQRNDTNAIKACFTSVQDEANKPKYSNTTVFAIPSRESDVRQLMARNPDLFNVTLVGEMYDRYFEVVLGYWLTNANQTVTSSDFKTFGGLLGGAKDPTDSSSIPNYQGLQFC